MDGRASARDAGLTAEEFARDYMAKRAELVAGEVVESAPVGLPHGRVVMQLGLRIGDHLAAHPEQGIVATEVGFIVERGPDVVYGPDLAVLAPDRSRQDNGWVPGAPDLAVEVLSPHDRWRDLMGKALRYLAAGSRAVWLVDLAGAVVTVVHPDAPPTVLRAGDTLDGAPVLPGFTLALSDVFP